MNEISRIKARVRKFMERYRNEFFSGTTSELDGAVFALEQYILSLPLDGRFTASTPEELLDLLEAPATLANIQDLNHRIDTALDLFGDLQRNVAALRGRMEAVEQTKVEPTSPLTPTRITNLEIELRSVAQRLSEVTADLADQKKALRRHATHVL